MRSFKFKYFFFIFMMGLLATYIYYYYHNYIEKLEPEILKADGLHYKEKQKITVKKEETDKSIYKSRINRIEEHYFKIIDYYEKPKKISDIIYANQEIKEKKNSSIFESNYHDSDSEVRILFINTNNKKTIKNSSVKSMYYIQLGIFDSKDSADKALQELHSLNKKSLSDINSIFEHVVYKNKAFIKLIIPSINSFSEARQICRYIKEFHNYCLIKTVEYG